MNLPNSRSYAAPCHMGHVDFGRNDYRKDAPLFNIPIVLHKTEKALSDQNVAIYKRNSLDNLIHLRNKKRIPSPVLQLYI